VLIKGVHLLRVVGQDSKNAVLVLRKEGAAKYTIHSRRHWLWDRVSIQKGGGEVYNWHWNKNGSGVQHNGHWCCLFSQILHVSLIQELSKIC